MNIDKSLLASAKAFLVESLLNYQAGKRKFAILHAVTATELVFKERLARIHPHLIFKNIDAKDLRKEQTVSLGAVTQRLANLGVAVDSQDADLIRTFCEWRNQIVHHMPAFDEGTAHLQLPRLLDFLALFMRMELDAPLETVLPKNLYSTAQGLLSEWKRVSDQAVERARAIGGVLPQPCPDCGASDVLTIREDERVICHLCESLFYRYDRCTGCDRETVLRLAAFDDGNYCDDCINAAGERWIQDSIDRERGK